MNSNEPYSPTMDPSRFSSPAIDESGPMTPIQRERARTIAELIHSGANPLFAIARTLAPVQSGYARA